MAQANDSRLERFLHGAAAKWRQPDMLSQQPVTVVMGNESCDLDSVVSATVCAMAMQNQSASPAVIPVANVPRQDLLLRKDILLAFKIAGVTLDCIPCTDEIDLKKLHDSGKLSLVMVDHNRLALTQQYLADSVTHIIDHRPDENLYPQIKPANRHVEEDVGSCVTMLAQSVCHPDIFQFDRETSLLFISTILLDTNNFSPDKRWKSKDKQLVESLAHKYLPADFSLSNHYATLLHARTSIEVFTPEELMRRDQKAGKSGNISYVTSIVTASMEEVTAKHPTFFAEVSSYAQQTRADIACVLFVYDVKGALFRQLSLISQSPALLRHVTKSLQSSDLNLQPLECKQSSDMAARGSLALFQQQNVRASRKQVLPLLQEALLSAGKGRANM